MIYLHKILPFFLSPLGISLILLILFFIYRKKTFVSLKEKGKLKTDYERILEDTDEDSKK